MLFGFDRSGNGRSTNTCIQIKQMLVLVAVMTQMPVLTALQSTGPQKFVLQTSNDNGSISLTTDNLNTSDEEDNNILDNLKNPPIEHSNSELDMPPNYSQTEDGSSALEQQIRASVKSQIRLEQNFDSSVIDALEDIADPEVRQTLAEDLVVFKYPRNVNNQNMLNDEPPNEDFGYDGETTTELTTEFPETTTFIAEMEENSITDKPELILQNKSAETQSNDEITENVDNKHSIIEEETEERAESTTLETATNIRNSLDDSNSSESIEVEEQISSASTEPEIKSNSKVTDNSSSEELELNTESNALATIEVTTVQMEVNSRKALHSFEESSGSTTFAESKDSESSEIKLSTPFLTTTEFSPNDVGMRVQYTTELLPENMTNSNIEDSKESIPSIEDNEITDPEQEDEPGKFHLTEERITKIKSLAKKYELDSSKNVQLSTVAPLEITQNNPTNPEVGMSNELSETTTPNKFEQLQNEKLLVSGEVPPEVSRTHITNDTNIDSNSINFRNPNNSESKSFELMIPTVDAANVVTTSEKDKGHHSSAVHRNGNSINSLLTDKELETFAKGTNSALPDLAFLPKAAGRNFDENVAVESSIRGDSLATHTSDTSKFSSNSEMIVVVALCSLTAFTFLAFSTMIFLKAFHRQHGTLDIEMQEQRCGKDDLDEEDAETRIKLLNPPTPPPPFDNDDE